jgi:hypothetical protein
MKNPVSSRIGAILFIIWLIFSIWAISTAQEEGYDSTSKAIKPLETIPGSSTSQNVEYIGRVGSSIRDGHLRAVDVCNPAYPAGAGFYNTPDFAGGVTVSEDCVYVAAPAGGAPALQQSPLLLDHLIHLPLIFRK